MSLNCEQIRDHLASFVDEQLEPQLHGVVSAHLVQCADCQARQEELSALHDALREALRPPPERVAAIAEKAILNWQTTTPTTRRTGLTVMRYLAAAAAGFLLAAMLFGPVKQPRRVTVDSDPAPTSPTRVGPPADPVAHIVLATGPVQFRRDAQAEWETIEPAGLATFACPSESVVKTERAALCELNTVTGAQIRLNGECEVALVSGQEVELRRGQLWCQAPVSTTLEITAAKSSTKPTSWTCAAGSESLASVSADGNVRVLAASGRVDVTAENQQHALSAGLVCSTTADEVTVRPSAEEVLFASRWMQPLLSRDGYNSPELERRVDALLARVGRAKLSFLFEQDLRNLGEYGALPLLRFVQTTGMDADGERRRIAMRILSDTAPVWMVPDLINLLSDVDPQVRSLSASALTRLTGESQELNPEDWEGDQSRWASGLAGWRQWWAQHGVSCALPPPGVPARSAPSAQDATELLKVRNSH